MNTVQASTERQILTQKRRCRPFLEDRVAEGCVECRGGSTCARFSCVGLQDTAGFLGLQWNIKSILIMQLEGLVENICDWGRKTDARVVEHGRLQMIAAEHAVANGSEWDIGNDIIVA